MLNVAAKFGATMPEFYDKCMGPAWFEPFGADLVARMPANLPGDVLEIASGTGIVTKQLRDRLDPARRVVASDISKPMLEYAHNKLVEYTGIEWREADATSLPFSDGEFDAVVCAFGAMFVPDRRAFFREARRVLKKNGVLLFSVWDRVEENPHAIAFSEVIEGFFPGDPEMRFQFPYEMHDRMLLRQLLDEAGFQEQRIERKQIQVDGVSAYELAVGLIRGSPRSSFFEKKGVSLDAVIEKLAAALANVGGADPYRAPASAVVVEACAIG